MVAYLYMDDPINDDKNMNEFGPEGGPGEEVATSFSAQAQREKFLGGASSEQRPPTSTQQKKESLSRRIIDRITPGEINVPNIGLGGTVKVFEKGQPKQEASVAEKPAAPKEPVQEQKPAQSQKEGIRARLDRAFVKAAGFMIRGTGGGPH